MAETAATALIDAIHDWGVDVVFGLPGDGINGIMEALRQRQGKVGFVQVRHEESAAFMATAWAKLTGRLGCCLATSGPGGIHLLNGLYDAKLDGVPVLAITGMQFHDLLHTYTQQDVELDKVFMDVAVYNSRVMGPAHVENIADLACRSALAPPRRRPHHHARRPSGGDAGRRSSQRPQQASPHLGRPRALGRPADRSQPHPRRRDPQFRPAHRHHGRARCHRLRRRVAAGGRDPGRPHRQAAAGQDVRSRRQPLYHRGSRGCSARCPRRRRWSAAIPCSSSDRPSPISNIIPSPARRAASRSTSTPSASACATRSRWDWSAIPCTPCAG